MPNEMQMNPDYQLVMTFLQNIRPGDMDEESAKQLMAIGQRIQGGGVLTDREREMFTSVVGATDRFPVEQMDTFPQGTNPDIMKDFSMGRVSEGEMRLAMNKAMPTNLTPEQMDQFMEKKNAAMAKMADATMDGRARMDKGAQMAGRPPMPGKAGMAPSGDMAPSNVMGLQEAIDAGFVTVNRPQTRPSAPMTSMRPQTRRTQ